MADAVRVLLIEDNRIEARQTIHWLQSVKDFPISVESVDSLHAGIDRLSSGGIEIVILDLNLPDSRGIETYTKIHQHSPEVPVVVLTGELSDSIEQIAVAGGAQDYLLKPQMNASTLLRAIRHALARHQSMQESLRRASRDQRGKCIGFIGAKGGVGTTTAALNVAQELSLLGKRTILVELRPSFGTLSCQLRQNPMGNLGDILDTPPEQIGAVQLGSVICPASSGLQILFGPQEATVWKPIDSRHSEAVLKGLLGMAEYVVLDLPDQPSEATQTAVELCDFVVVVTEREPAAIQAGNRVVRFLEAWGIKGMNVGAIVVTRTVFPNTLKVDEVQSGLGCPIVGLIPPEPAACLKAVNVGIPMVIVQRDNDAARNLAEIAKKYSIGTLTPLNL